MLDLVGNPKDRFSRIAADMIRDITLFCMYSFDMKVEF